MQVWGVSGIGIGWLRKKRAYEPHNRAGVTVWPSRALLSPALPTTMKSTPSASAILASGMGPTMGAALPRLAEGRKALLLRSTFPAVKPQGKPSRGGPTHAGCEGRRIGGEGPGVEEQRREGPLPSEVVVPVEDGEADPIRVRQPLALERRPRDGRERHAEPLEPDAPPGRAADAHVDDRRPLHVEGHRDPVGIGGVEIGRAHV